MVMVLVGRDMLSNHEHKTCALGVSVWGHIFISFSIYAADILRSCSLVNSMSYFANLIYESSHLNTLKGRWIWESLDIKVLFHLQNDSYMLFCIIIVLLYWNWDYWLSLKYYLYMEIILFFYWAFYFYLNSEHPKKIVVPHTFSVSNRP